MQYGNYKNYYSINLNVNLFDKRNYILKQDHSLYGADWYRFFSDKPLTNEINLNIKEL